MVESSQRAVVLEVHHTRQGRDIVWEDMAGFGS